MSRLFPIATSAVLVALLMTACDRKETPAPAPPFPPKPFAGVLRMENATVRNDGVLCTKATGQPFTGTLHEHWPSGKLRRETAMKEGQRHGSMKVWYENGQVETTGQFVMGQPVDVYIKISKKKTPTPVPSNLQSIKKIVCKKKKTSSHFSQKKSISRLISVLHRSKC